MKVIGRNDPCPCGSGKKYKKCCTPKFDPAPTQSRGELGPDGKSWMGNVSKGDAQTYREPSRWPLAWVQVPRPEVWAVTGVGLVGVVRATSDDVAAYAGFGLELNDGGLKVAFGKVNITVAEGRQHIVELRENCGPGEAGDGAMAATLVHASIAYGRSRGVSLAPGTEGFLSLLPAIDRSVGIGSIAGVGRTLPRALIDVVDAHGHLTDVEQGAEVAIFSSAEFVLADPAAAIAALRARSPEFDLNEDAEGAEFEFTRPSKPGQRSPLSRIEGRRVQGVVTVKGDRLLATCGALSMAAKLIDSVLEAVPVRPRLESVIWMSPTLAKKWSWRAADEPLAMHRRLEDGG